VLAVAGVPQVAGVQFTEIHSYIVGFCISGECRSRARTDPAYLPPGT